MKTKILVILIVAIIIIGGGIWYWYGQIPRCPESCDDGNPCTKDFCSSETNYQCEHSPIVGATEGCQGLVETCQQYQCLEGECQIITLADCCGNGKCETGEDWETCPQDCEHCDDGNPCTEDTYSYETGKCSYLKLTGTQLGCSAEVTCGSYTCKTGACQIEYVSNCCGNKICEVGETYETCPADCPNCDDNNECTKDSYDYHKQKCVNTPILDVICCGNGVCETGETYQNCSRDCPNCDDDNECTKDSYDYHQQKCINEIIIPCCGNGICDEDAETYSNCPADCPNCDDNNKLTADSFNYETQRCEHILYYLFEDFEDGDLSGWDTWKENPEDVWEVISENENKIVRGYGHAGMNGGSQSWTDYTFIGKLKLIKGCAAMQVRGNESGNYEFIICRNEISLSVFTVEEYKIYTEIARKSSYIPLNKWHDFKIVVGGTNLKFYLNDNLIIDADDKDNIHPKGRIGVESRSDSEVYFDDFKVKEL